MSQSNGRKSGRKKRNPASLIILIAAAVVLVIALWRLIPILMDYRQSDEVYENLQGDIVDIASDSGNYGDEDQDQAVSPWNLYDWASVTIDFNSLWAINPDVVGWIRFDDTDAVNVDYPILHGTDNDVYLRTDLYGDYHTSGSIFLEAANASDFSDIYNIIYGHNMRNGTMFGTLRKYRDSDDFYDANRYFTIYTPRAAYRYEIFGYADVPDDSLIYTVGYAPDAAYQGLISLMLSTSTRNTGIVPTVNQQTVTLSTCTATGDDYRFVVFGVCVDVKVY